MSPSFPSLSSSLSLCLPKARVHGILHRHLADAHVVQLLRIGLNSAMRCLLYAGAPVPYCPHRPQLRRRSVPYLRLLITIRLRLRLRMCHRQAVYELQVNSDRLKQTLREVQFTSAKEIEVADGKKAVLVFVPVPQLALYQKMIKEKGLIEELEKKFSGKHVMLLGEVRGRMQLCMAWQDMLPRGGAGGIATTLFQSCRRCCCPRGRIRGCPGAKRLTWSSADTVRDDFSLVHDARTYTVYAFPSHRLLTHTFCVWPTTAPHYSQGVAQHPPAEAEAPVQVRSTSLRGWEDICCNAALLPQFCLVLLLLYLPLAHPHPQPQRVALTTTCV